MFALEITFQDGISEPEMIYVRRPHALIGASDYAHVVIDDMKNLGYQLRLTRELGRRFRLRAAGSDLPQLPPGIEGVFEAEADIDTGAVRIHITALDSDLSLRDGEAPDVAGVRILRQACAVKMPLFPAVLVAGSVPMVISFHSEQPIFIGRSKLCALRLDSSDISAKHARIGFENGQFWVEDLGSTNGTYVNNGQISGRVSVPPAAPIVLGREITIFGVVSEDQIKRVANYSGEKIERAAPSTARYPAIVSASEIARPARVVVAHGAELNVGRDPSCDMWLGAPHVSRRHFSLTLGGDGQVLVTDQSTNGTAYEGGILRKGDVLDVSAKPQILDLGSGVTVAVCFSDKEERQFMAAHGATHAFSKISPAAATTPSSVMMSGRDFDDPIWNLERQRDGPRINFWNWLFNVYRESGPFGKAAFFSSFIAFLLVLWFAVILVYRLLM